MFQGHNLWPLEAFLGQAPSLANSFQPVQASDVMGMSWVEAFGRYDYGVPSKADEVGHWRRREGIAVGYPLACHDSR